MQYCLVTIHAMQSFDTNSPDSEQLRKPSRAVDAGRVEDLPHGSSKTIDLPEGRELTLYNANGEFYATDNFCPHKGAPLANGTLCE
jgi:nitrite reductase/ring-hydroxylating ferredoxin subunit